MECATYFRFYRYMTNSFHFTLVCFMKEIKSLTDERLLQVRFIKYALKTCLGKILKTSF